VETLKLILQAELGIPPPRQALMHNGNILGPGSLSSLGVRTGDLIMVVPAAAPSPASTPARRPAGSTRGGAPGQSPGPVPSPQELLAQLRALPPAQRDSLPPAIQAAVDSGDLSALEDAVKQMVQARRQAEAEEARFARLAAEDPLNPEVQARLEQAIQQKNIMENFEAAMEYNPEAFGSVAMLYVNMEVNGVPLKGFVDSGAQTTIMSKNCAERCNLLRLMDTRFQGLAVGVGSAKILGRIHLAPATAAGQSFPISITVLEQDGMEFLFGLDNLKRHQCSIDLKDNALHFPHMDLRLPFLPEHEIPRRGTFHGPDADAGGMPSPHVPAPAQSPAQAPQQQPAGSSAGQQAQSLPAGWEEKVQRLMALGNFPREACVGSLRAAEGNEDVAASLLFNL